MATTPTVWPIHADEAGYDVLREGFLNLEEIAFVGKRENQLLHVVGLGGAVRYERVEAHFKARRIIEDRANRWLLAIVERQEVEQDAYLFQSLNVVLIGAIGHRGFFRVGGCTAQFLSGHDFVGDGFDHIWACHKHVGRIAYHENEVGHGRGIDGTAGAWPHDDGNLRHDARRIHIAFENIGIACQRCHAFLDARAAGIVKADDRRAVFYGHVHDLADFLRMGFRKRAAQNREVLAEHIDLTAIDGAPARYHAVARNFLLRHAEIGAAMRDIHVELLERSFVEKHFDSFARGKLAFAVLGIDTALSAAKASLGAACFELFKKFLHSMTFGNQG
ncbi:hypothetical protein H721_01164 [Brucella ovis IntaBari-2006-46-332]|nr:hypothetical protein C010_01145 [Brucella ovis 80/125]ENR08516.1 hypothetical protein C961_01138 [Brucella ovis F8/05B]ENS95163.1 hypothetical protein B999_01472 [Brucella ovis 63/96]ENS99935.1 hypothetical protein C009_01159 [Brucella ovis 81/8]ENT78939.1 hypothetical protein H712_01140 [Brucella ovis IntaBari-2009-88-4]ENT80800.1 hypothetical protein H720_01146 [Brucella ovis IntaBari-2006-46-348]ENT84393.1 hypothetical protein H713_01142 [Brucella ovis IntaBari-2010-47-268]ENT89180.1 h